MFPLSLRFLRILALLPLPLLAAPGDFVETTAPPIVKQYSGSLCAARMSDGKWLVGTSLSFSSSFPARFVVSDEIRGSLVRLNPDLSLDETFFDPAIRSVRALEPGPDGTVYVLSSVKPLPDIPFVTRLLKSGAPDPTFDSAVKQNTTAIRTDPHGRILVAGNFTVTHGGPTVTSVARLMPDGSLDPSFSTQIQGPVSHFTLQDDGKILICGTFTAVSGISRRLVARLNEDGSLDATFNAEANFASNGTAAFAMQSWDSSIFLSGNVLHEGASKAGIIRLLPDGSRDPEFFATSWGGASGAILLANGGMIVPRPVYQETIRYEGWSTLSDTGSVTRAWAPSTTAYTRFLPAEGNLLFATGAVDSKVAIYAENDPGESTLQLDPTTGILRWTRSGTDPALARARFEILDPHGNWQPLPPAVRAGQSWTLQIADLPAHGAIRATGDTLHTWASSSIRETLSFGETSASLVWTDASGTPASGTANLGTASPVVATRLPLFISNPGTGAAGGLSASISGPHAADFSLRTPPPLILDPGTLTQLSVAFKPGAAGLREATLTITAADSPEMEPLVIPLRGHGQFAINPSFPSSSSIPMNLGALDRTHQVAESSQHLSGMTVGTIELGFVPQGPLILTLFDAGSGVIRSPFANLANQQFVEAVYEGTTYRFQAFYSTDSKKILLSFTGAGATDTRFRGYRSNSMTLDQEGDLWIAWSYSTNHSLFETDNTTGATIAGSSISFTTLHMLCTLANGSILAGGEFLPQTDRPQSHLARVIPGSGLDPHFAPQFNGRVRSALADTQGRILAAGNFTAVQGSPAPRLVRLMNDGSIDASFDTSAAAPDGEVTSMALQRSGGIVIAGNFTHLGGAPRSGLGRLGVDGMLDSSFAPTLNAGGKVNVIAEDSFGRILIGGTFTSVAGHPRPYLARLLPGGAVDLGFAPSLAASVVSLTTDTLGRVLLLHPGFGSQPQLLRLLENGSRDPDFNPDMNPQYGTWVIGTPNGSAYVSAASFTGPWSNAGAFRYFGGPAGETLEAPQSGGLRWSADGAFPAVGRVSFSVSAGDVSSVFLGHGIMTDPGVWELPDVPIPSPSYIKTKVWIPTPNGGYFHDTGLSIGPASPSLSAFSTADSPITGIEMDARLTGFEDNATIRIYNTGNVVLSDLSALFPTQGLEDGFSVLSTPPAELIPGDWFELRLRFSPSLAGTRQSVLTISDGTTLLEIPVTGTSSPTTSVTLSDTTRPLILPDGVIPAGTDVFLTLGFHPAPGTQITLVDNLSANPLTGIFASVQPDDIIHLVHEGQSYAFVVGYQAGTGNDLVLTLVGPGTGDPAFKNPTANIWSLTRQRDGRILAGGGAGPTGGLVRLLPDGTLDPTFKRPTFNGNRIECIRVLPDDRIMICGGFRTVNGVSREFIARLHPDGSLDLSFNATASIFTSSNGTSLVNRMLVDNQGRIIVGGMGWGTLIRLLPDGAADPSFPRQNNLQVKSLVWLQDGYFLSGGLAPTITKHSPDGAWSSDFSTTVGPASGFTSRCYGMLYEENPAGDRIMIAGAFTSVNGVPRSRIARLLPNGALDPTFVPPDISATIACILRQTDGKYVISGYFKTVANERRVGIARLMPDGTLDPSFIPSLQPTPSDQVYSSLLLEDGSILTGGNFLSASGIRSTYGLARLFNESASSELAVAPNNTITWTRSATSPDLHSVALRYSIDGGATWVPLPPALRSPDGWTLADAPLPASGILRSEALSQQGPRSGGAIHSYAVFGREPTPAEHWRTLHFGSPLTAGLGADDADPDADGICNLLERAFALDPWKNHSNQLPQWSLDHGQMSIHFERPAVAENLHFTAEWSPSLREDDWHSLPNTDLDSGFYFTLPAIPNGNAFGRLRVIED